MELEGQATIVRETEHRDFTFAEVEELGQDLAKLKRWYRQVQQRDYFPAASRPLAEVLLEQTDQALAAFIQRAADREVTAS